MITGNLGVEACAKLSAEGELTSSRLKQSRDAAVHRDMTRLTDEVRPTVLTDWTSSLCPHSLTLSF